MQLGSVDGVVVGILLGLFYVVVHGNWLGISQGVGVLVGDFDGNAIEDALGIFDGAIIGYWLETWSSGRTYNRHLAGFQGGSKSRIDG